MYRRTAILLFATAIVAIPSRASAQQDNPFIGPFWEIRGHWTLTPSRDNSFGVFNSRPKAEREIATLNRDYASGGLLEGLSNRPFGLYIVEPKDGAAMPGPKMPTFLQALSNVSEATEGVAFSAKFAENRLAAVAKKFEPSQGLKDFIKGVQGSFEQAKRAKEALLATNKTITEKQFREANALIAQYNRDVQQFQKGPNGAAFARFPRLTPVTPGVIQNAERWRSAVAQNLKLENEKEKLSEEKARLDEQREKLIEERSRLEAAPNPTREAERRRKVQEFLQDKAKYSVELAGFQGRIKDYSQQLAGLKTESRPTAIVDAKKIGSSKTETPIVDAKKIETPRMDRTALQGSGEERVAQKQFWIQSRCYIRGMDGWGWLDWRFGTASTLGFKPGPYATAQEANVVAEEQGRRRRESFDRDRASGSQAILVIFRVVQK
jgi:hypothetical protein